MVSLLSYDGVTADGVWIGNMIYCTSIRTISQSTDVQHITSLYQIAYVQRIRCIKNSP
jgi:hypothetical protein